MKTRNYNQRRLSGLPLPTLISFCCVMVLGCAATPSKVAMTGFPLVVHSPGSIVITSAKATMKEGDWVVTGSVRAKFGYSPSVHSHLDILEKGEEGEILSALAINYFPKPIRPSLRGMRRSSHFSTRLPSTNPVAGHIVVKHHQTLLANCEYSTAKVSGKIGK